MKRACRGMLAESASLQPQPQLQPHDPIPQANRTPARISAGHTMQFLLPGIICSMTSRLAVSCCHMHELCQATGEHMIESGTSNETIDAQTLIGMFGLAKITRPFAACAFSLKIACSGAHENRGHIDAHCYHKCQTLWSHAVPGLLRM